jgi:endoglucanase
LDSEKLHRIDLMIPQPDGTLPQMLSEIRWNLDWMLKMQDESGGVWHKATTAKFPGPLLPERDNARMLIVGSGYDPYLTTQATCDFVAVTAIAARVYRPFDPDYAARCLKAAIICRLIPFRRKMVGRFLKRERRRPTFQLDNGYRSKWMSM